MTEKEKEAVERIEDAFYSDLGKGINNFQKITLYEDSIRDVRILLNLIEKLQKENEELKLGLREMTISNEHKKKEWVHKAILNSYIPKQKIKDMTDRIDYDIKKTKEIISNDPKNNYQIIRLKAMNTKSLDIKKRLQELLESEVKK